MIPFSVLESLNHRIVFAELDGAADLSGVLRVKGTPLCPRVVIETETQATHVGAETILTLTVDRG